jgi:hypothetical protein
MMRVSDHGDVHTGFVKREKNLIGGSRETLHRGVLYISGKDLTRGAQP